MFSPQKAIFIISPRTVAIHGQIVTRKHPFVKRKSQEILNRKCSHDNSVN